MPAGGGCEIWSLPPALFGVWFVAEGSADFARVLDGMAREDVVPAVFARVHPERTSPYVGLILSFVLAAVLMVSALRLRGLAEGDDTFRASAPTWVYDEPDSLGWVVGLLGVGISR